MKTYILSSDNWFALGLAHLFTEAEHEAEILNLSAGACCLQQVDEGFSVIIIDVQDPELLKIIFRQGEMINLYPVFVTHYDKNEYYGRQYCDIFIPKKICRSKVFCWLNRYFKNMSDQITGLTLREQRVLQFLLEGVTPVEIADLLDIPVKSISVFKCNALKKLGLKRMNARSLFYIRDYIYREIYLSSCSPYVENRKMY